MTPAEKAEQERALATHEWEANLSPYHLPPRCKFCHGSFTGLKAIRDCAGTPIRTLDTLAKYRRALEDIAGGLYLSNHDGLATREQLISLAKLTLGRKT